MIGPLSAATATRLEKTAIDNGFDQELPAPGGWLGFVSTQAPLRIWLNRRIPRREAGERADQVMGRGRRSLCGNSG
jgi:hypothetical protein